MKIISETINRIESLNHCKAAYTVANALASACNQKYGVSLLAISTGLDKSNFVLIQRLSAITKESDFSNKAQDEALVWLRENNYIDNK